MLLFKKILLFILSLFFIILFFIASSTSYAKSEYNAETLEKNVRFYTIEFLDIPDENGKKYVCGTKISTYDYSGRKYIIEYYYLLTNKNQIVTQFSVDAIQMSVLNPDTPELEHMDIKLYASILKKDGEGFLAGVRANDDKDKGVGAEYTEFDREGNTAIFKMMYKGDFELEVHAIPKVPLIIPIKKNVQYNKENEVILDNCIDDLISNKKSRLNPKEFNQKYLAYKVS